MNIGDLNVRLILEVVGAQKNVKEFSADLRQTEVQADKTAAKVVTLGDRFQNIGLRVEGLRSVLGVLHSTFGALIDDYDKQEVALAKLTNGLKNVGEGTSAVERLSKQASELQNTTPFADEEINNAQAMLTTFKKNSDQIEILTPRILDLAAAFQKSGESGMDLQQIAVMLGKVNEESIGTLRRVGVAFSKEQEEKIKSLHGTEQTIYLAQILDQNFKGMAETVGNTAAGKMAIFKNRVGEVREGLGKVLAEGLIPIVNIFGPFVNMLANGSEVTKRLTLGVIALGTAYVILGTSLGGLPFVIGAIVTLFYSLSSSAGTTAESLKKMSAETLRSKEVNSDMKKMLESLKLSANNMSEAYDGISKSIAGMTKTQLLSTKAFIEAEKAKVLALIESMHAMQMSQLPADFVPPDFGKSLEGSLKVGFGADLGKFDELLSQIDSKLSFAPSEGGSSNTGSNSNSTTTKEEQLTYLQELEKQLKEIDERISKQSKSESEAEGLFIKKKEVEDSILYVKNLEQMKVLVSAIATVGEKSKTGVEPIDDDFLKFLNAIRKQKESTVEAEKSYDKIVSSLQSASSLVGAISSKLSGGGRSFLSYIQGALQVAIRISEYVKLSKSKDGAGIFDFLPIIGAVVGMFPGFATGGIVPGHGNSDSALIRATPGEGILNRAAMSKVGSQFVNWLNGSGSVSGLSPGVAMSGGSPVVINIAGELTEHLMHKIVSKGQVIVNRRKKNFN